MDRCSWRRANPIYLYCVSTNTIEYVEPSIRHRQVHRVITRLDLPYYYEKDNIIGAARCAAQPT